MWDYTDNVRSSRTVPCDKERFYTVARSAKVETVCRQLKELHDRKESGEITQEEFEKAKSPLKQQLPAFLFHAHFSDGRRWNASAVPSGLSILDIDHIAPAPPAREVMKSLGIVLVHKTPSCEGLRIVFRIPQVILDSHPVREVQGAGTSVPQAPGGNCLAEAQKWLARQLGIKEYDSCVKDYARCSFAVPESYIYYIDEEGLFEAVASTADGPEAVAPTSKSNQHPLHSEGLGEVSPLPLEGPGEAFLLAVRSCGLTPADLDHQGRRHNSLLAVLSTGITRIIPKERLRQCVARYAPGYYQDPNCQQLIDDWYAKYTDTNAPMSQRLQKIFSEAVRLEKEREAGQDAAGDAPPHATGGPPPLNIDMLPRALRDTLVTTPEDMRWPVLFAVMPLVAAYADGVEFNYIDGTVTRMNMLSFIVGPQASGKSACSRMLRVWLAPMLEADEAGRKTEAEWKEQDRMRAANKKGQRVPHVVIRYIPPTISVKKLLIRLVDAQGHTLYMWAEEADSFIKNNKAGAYSQNDDIIRAADDNGKLGVDYANNESTPQLVEVRLNITLMGTPGSFRRLFDKDNVENGLSSRFLIAEMPDDPFAPMPRYGKITDTMAGNINDAIVRLSAMKGRVEMPHIARLIDEWQERKRIEADKEDNRVKALYRKRAAKIAMRCGVLFALMEGRESARILKTTGTVADYILYEQCKLYGEQLMSITEKDTIKPFHASNRSLFDMLPAEFSAADIGNLRKGCSGNNIRQIIHRWTKRQFIEKVTKDRWRKKA